jgi:hypothetical protein
LICGEYGGVEEDWEELALRREAIVRHISTANKMRQKRQSGVGTVSGWPGGMTGTSRSRGSSERDAVPSAKTLTTVARRGWPDLFAYEPCTNSG